MSAPNAIVPIALGVFVLFVLGCFMQFPLRRAIDDVFNAMLSPIFPVIAGSLAGLYLTVMAARRRQPRPGDSQLLPARFPPRRVRWGLIDGR